MPMSLLKRGIAVGLGVVATVSMAACAAGKPPSNAGSDNRHTASPAPSARTAAQDLASFFSAAQQDDARLRTAATMVNAGITTNSMQISQATVDAVRAADPQPVAAAIPAGLDPALLQPVLLVYSELDSRYMAMYHLQFLPGTFPNSGDTASTYQGFMRCLGNGATGASRFPADLAALQQLATAAPAVTIAAPDSRAAAELALRIADIREANGGCASCGGQLASTLAPISWGWQGTSADGRWMWRDGSTAPPDGTIRGVPFHVSYQPGKGWFADEYVC